MTEKKRQSNFELLRIIAMLMIIGSHLACHGIQHVTSTVDSYQIYLSGTDLNKAVISFLNMGGEVGVAIFFMITGYFQINKNKYSLSKILFETVFYGWFSFILLIIVHGMGYKISQLGLKDDLNFTMEALLNPVSSGMWWFVTAYVLLLILSPYINRILWDLNYKGWIFIMALIWGLWYSVGYIYKPPFYSLQKAVYFYILGAFCRIHLKNLKSRLLYVLLEIIFGGMGTVLFWKMGEHFNITGEINYIFIVLNVVKTAVIVPTCSYILFRIFESLKIHNSRIINLVASSTFGVYLIHDSLVSRNFIWYNLFKVETLYRSKLFPLYAILIIIIVFGVCTIIDSFRIKYIEPLGDKIINKILEKIKINFIKTEKI